MRFILIIFFAAGGQNGASVTSIEFHSERACQSAGIAAVKQGSDGNKARVSFACVPKDG